MELSDLEAYVAVVEHDGFRRAADALFVSQPSLTRRVARLEQELKITLLERGPRGIHMTTRGKALLSGARRILATVEETRATASGSWSDNLVIACTATSAGSCLTEFLASWIPENPGTRIRMVEDGPLHTRQRLIDHGCDAAIVATPLDRDFDSLPVRRAQVQVLLPPGHRLAAGDGPVGLEELDREPILVTGEQYLSSQLLRSACRVAGIQPQIVFECSVGQTLAALVQAGLGIAVVSNAVERQDNNLVVRSLSGTDGRPISFDLHIAWARNRVLNPALHKFASELLGVHPAAAQRDHAPQRLRMAFCNPIRITHHSP